MRETHALRRTCPHHCAPASPSKERSQNERILSYWRMKISGIRGLIRSESSFRRSDTDNAEDWPTCMSPVNCGPMARPRLFPSEQRGRTLRGHTCERELINTTVLTCRWNQSIVLPITYPSLLPNSQLAFTIWDVQGAGKNVPVGGTTMSLFSSDRCSSPNMC